MKATDIKAALVGTPENPTPTSVKMLFSLEITNIEPTHAPAIADLGSAVPSFIQDAAAKNLFGMLADGSRIAGDITTLTKKTTP